VAKKSVALIPGEGISNERSGEMVDHGAGSSTDAPPPDLSESWEQFASRVEPRLRGGEATPEVGGLGAVFETLDANEQRSVSRIFRYGTPTRTRLARLLGQVSSRHAGF
jgi:hypothetical protein